MSRYPLVLDACMMQLCCNLLGKTRIISSGIQRRDKKCIQKLRDSLDAAHMRPNHITLLERCDIYLDVNLAIATQSMLSILLTVCIFTTTSYSLACGRVRRVCDARHPSILSLHHTKHQTLHISNQGRDKITSADFFFHQTDTHTR